MTSTHDALQKCSRCKNFDLSPILAREEHLDCWSYRFLRESTKRFELGPLNSLFYRAHTCKVCKFVCETLEEHIDADELMKIRYNKSGYSCDLVWNEHDRMDLSGRVTSSIYRLDIALLYFNSDDHHERSIGYNLYGPLQPSLWPVPQLESPGGASQYWNSFQSGRLRPPVCQPDILRTWLQKCESRHIGCWWVGPKVPLRLRLFDVKFRCIRNFQVSQDDSVRYVALSYVWGSQAQRLILNKANRDVLGNKQTIELGHLSRTISDAATVVEMLSERYLWVDALCIIQDDPDDLAAQIPVMGQIYARSLLTIVAAASKDAGTGLPGVGTQARSVQRNLGPLKGGTLLTTCTSKPLKDMRDTARRDQHYLAHSKWNTRGWTFQEMMLSRRCLFFMEEQVYWECQCASWCEETCLETGPETRISRYGQPMFFSNKSFSAGQRMLGEDATRSFSYLVEGYTSRSLTFETDSYRAFGGLVQILDELTGARFWHGIPVPDFNRRLFWVNQEESTLKSGENFPSWSWLAWTGSISMIPCGPLKQVAKVISYCLCLDSSGRKHLDPVSNDLHIQYRYDTIKANDIAIHSWSKLRVGFHIVFWAMSAILIVVNGGYGIRHTVPERNPTEDEHGRHGHVVAASGGYTNGAHEFVHIETELELDDCARHVHLLIISWQDGIARRVGAAIFDAHEWMMAMPQRKLIVMG